MAHGGTDKYYNPANKVVNDGNTAFAGDINNINYAVDTSLARVADDLDVMDVRVTTLSAEAEAWAHNDQGIPPDPLEPAEFSSKAYATESKEYAIQAEGVVIHKADGTTQLIDSAYVSATKAAASQAAALTSKNAAALSETNAEAHSLQAWADQQVGFESMQDARAAASAAEDSADLAALSAANLPNATTAGADKMIVTNSSGDGWDYVSQVGFGRKNLLINGGFDVWQRGSSITQGSPVSITSDRWRVVNQGYSSICPSTASRRGVMVGESGGLFAARYVHRLSVQPILAVTIKLSQRIEDLIEFVGKTVTLSFYAKASVNTIVQPYFRYNYDDYPESYTNGEDVTAPNAHEQTITTSWARYSATVELPAAVSSSLVADRNSLEVILLFLPDTVRYVEIANAQLEFGDTATDFEYRHPAEELMLCQRYYEIGTNTIPEITHQFTHDLARTGSIRYKVTKRMTPTISVGPLIPNGYDGTPGPLHSTFTSLDEFCSQWAWTGGTPGRAFSAQFTWVADAEI